MRICFRKLENLRRRHGRTEDGHGRPAPGVLFWGLKGRRSMLIRAIFHARFWTIAREVEPDKMEAVAWGFASKILLKMADLNRRLTAPSHPKIDPKWAP